jgi:hypothetical protein
VEGKAGRGQGRPRVDDDGAEVMQAWSGWGGRLLGWLGLASDEGERGYKNFYL